VEGGVVSAGKLRLRGLVVRQGVNDRAQVKVKTNVGLASFVGVQNKFPKKSEISPGSTNLSYLRAISAPYQLFDLTSSLQHPHPNNLSPTMASSTILLPGETVPHSQLPESKKGTLTLGPNLRHLPQAPPASISILPTSSGLLQSDAKKIALWLDTPHARYAPSVGDLVVAQVHHSSTETYHVMLTPQTPYALLGQLAFEGANKKTRPKLEAGDSVYARVKAAGRGEDVEIECVSPNSGKADGMGPLKGGTVFNVSPAFARRLMMGPGKGGFVVLEELGEKLKFEVAVGRNGRVWVESGSVRATVAVGRLLVGCDEGGWGVEEQRREVRRAVREV